MNPLAIRLPRRLAAHALLLALAASSAFTLARAQLGAFNIADNGDFFFTQSDPGGTLSLFRYTPGDPNPNRLFRTPATGASTFSGGGVAISGTNVYFDYSTFDFGTFQSEFFIQRVAADGTASSVENTQANTLGAAASGGRFFTTIGGSPTSLNVSNIGPDGSLTDNPLIDISDFTSGASGPLAFDGQGNLFYASGTSVGAVFSFSAAEISDAVANPAANLLTDGPASTFAALGTQFDAFAGFTGLAWTPDGLYATLTDFSNTAAFIFLETNDQGDFVDASVIEQMSGRLGSVAVDGDGEIYVGFSDGIYQLQPDNSFTFVVPEPAAFAGILGLCALVLACSRRRRKGNPA